MPEDGVELSPKGHALSDDEIVRLASLFVQHGITKIRLTGGEPTIRKSIIELVGKLSQSPVARPFHELTKGTQLA